MFTQKVVDFYFYIRFNIELLPTQAWYRFSNYRT